ncbi:hypothetical protein MRB56_07155 [Halomonas cupida]|uniref:hypothetical protein n=1 Tax=Halomonas cupida TaxID=44933 RepID=UPI001160F746|nr:hypothetical protein [Halomonas cupida]
MAILYRVLPLTTWQQARAAGRVPRCGNDHKADGANLNLAEAIEYTARRHYHGNQTTHPDRFDCRPHHTGADARICWCGAVSRRPDGRRRHVPMPPLTQHESMPG